MTVTTYTHYQFHKPQFPVHSDSLRWTSEAIMAIQDGISNLNSVLWTIGSGCKWEGKVTVAICDAFRWKLATSKAVRSCFIWAHAIQIYTYTPTQFYTLGVGMRFWRPQWYPSEVVASKCLTGHPWPQHGLCLPVPWMKSGWETLETPLPQQVQHLKVRSWRDRHTEFSNLSQCVLVQDDTFFGRFGSVLEISELSFFVTEV